MTTFFSEHIFFVSASFFSSLWFIVFLFNKKNRKRMVLVSVVTMILSPLVEQMHFIDWWQPHFIFNSYIKIEDILFGFSTGGVISGVYSILQSNIKNKYRISLKVTEKIWLVFIFLFSLFGLFYIFHVHSFLSSIIALSVSVVMVAYKNRKLLPAIFLTGIIMTAIALAGYLFAIFINPHFVAETYMLNHLSGILIFGIPIEELIWFFFAGIGVSAFQEIMWD